MPYPLSPILFNLYISDLNEEIRKVREGGIVIGRYKIWAQIYADVILVVSGQELEAMISRFVRYIKKKLELSRDKSKVMVFEREVGGRVRRKWAMEDNEIKEVKEMTYLWYIFQKNRSTKRHVKERVRRAMLAMKNMWNIEERLWNGDFGRRTKMFDALVTSVALYGSEIWEWKREERIDSAKRK